MNERDVMTLLANANPVQEHDLTPLDVPDRFARRVPNRRLSLAIAIVALAGAALAGAYVFGASTSGRGGTRGALHRHHMHHGPRHGPTGANGATGAMGPSGVGGATGRTGPTGSEGPLRLGPTGGSGPARPTDPTTAYYTDGPTGATGPTTSLAGAQMALGAPLVVPGIPPVDSSHIGKVVKDCGESPRSTACDIGIGFPAQRVWIYYLPADQWSGSSDPLAAYRNAVKYNSRDRIVYLSGTPALIGSSGEIVFVLNGIRIRIWAVQPVPPSGPTVREIAQSIVDRSK